MKKLVFLTVLPSPYQRELFRALHESGDFDVHVLYYIHSVKDREWREVDCESYERVMPGRTLSWLGPSVHWNPGICQYLEELDADIYVVSDYSALTAQVAMRWLTANNKKWVYWGERPGMRSRSLLRNLLRAIMIRPLRKADAIVGIGQLALQLYRDVIARPEQLAFNIPYFCSTSQFESLPRPSERTEGPVTILFSGQFIHRKGIDVLLSAFRKVCEQHENVRLMLIGNGASEDELLSGLAADVRGRVEYVGFVQPEKLPEVFSRADIFVLPSRHDGWGLVINEALASGIPVITTTAVGAGVELIHNGVNGYLLEDIDADSLAESMLHMVASPELRRQLSRATAQSLPLIRLDEGVRRWREVTRALV